MYSRSVTANDERNNVRHIATFALMRVGDETALSALQATASFDDGVDYEGRPINELAARAIDAIEGRTSSS